jgi:hypothetical protein
MKWREWIEWIEWDRMDRMGFKEWKKKVMCNSLMFVYH